MVVVSRTQVRGTPVEASRANRHITLALPWSSWSRLLHRRIGGTSGTEETWARPRWMMAGHRPVHDQQLT